MRGSASQERLACKYERRHWSLHTTSLNRLVHFVNDSLNARFRRCFYKCVLQFIRVHRFGNIIVHARCQAKFMVTLHRTDCQCQPRIIQYTSVALPKTAARIISMSLDNCCLRSWRGKCGKSNFPVRFTINSVIILSCYGFSKPSLLMAGCESSFAKQT